jgi:hypothetical protein
MLAIALVTGDEFLVPYNLTIGTEKVLICLVGLLSKWSQKDFQRESYFDDKYAIEFNIVTGPSGFCYNFNMAKSEEVLTDAEM